MQQSDSRNTQSRHTDSGNIPTPSTQDLQDTLANNEDNAKFEGLNLMHIAREIKMITSKLATKNMKIDLLNTEVKAAYHTIERLQQRVTELEQQYCEKGDQNTHTCLLLGDTNLRSISRSDLQNSC